METKKKNNEIETWRGVHRALIQAVKCAEEAIAAQRAQKRYWLEEICANLDDDGGHQVTSVWKRAHAIVKKSGTTAKRSTTLLNSGSSNNSGGKLKKKPAAKRAKQPHENELDAQKPMKNPRKRKAKDSPEKKSSTVIKKIQQNQYISSKVSKPPSPERLVNEDDEDDDEQDEEEPEEEIEVEVEAEVEEEQVEGDEDSVEEESIEDESVSNSATVSSQPHVSDYSARQEQVESPYLHPHPQPGVVHSQKAPQWGSGTANLHMMVRLNVRFLNTSSFKSYPTVIHSYGFVPRLRLHLVLTPRAIHIR